MDLYSGDSWTKLNKGSGPLLGGFNSCEPSPPKRLVGLRLAGHIHSKSKSKVCNSESQGFRSFLWFFAVRNALPPP